MLGRVLIKHTAFGLRDRADMLESCRNVASEQQPTPSPRIKPGNIAYAAVFLASEESRMITGHILPVDRGIGD